ncbi:MAG: hypothetical protein A2Y79_07820 [Deltaproteobacteria bacterium RBG_13_43_22]|nr:MAG: hypothetical protein A2Y79_07820 [Deltaproteobacteria bacterium RBG_13_43_22]
MINTIKQWIGYTLISVGLGFLIGFVLIWSWSFFRILFLGYGDSGPAWINTINDIVFYGGMIVGVIGGQLIFFFKDQIISYFNERSKRKG